MKLSLNRFLCHLVYVIAFGLQMSPCKVAEIVIDETMFIYCHNGISWLSGL